MRGAGGRSRSSSGRWTARSRPACARRSSPSRCAIASASAAPARLMPASRLLTSLVRAPSPGRVPMRNTLRAEGFEQRSRLALELGIRARHHQAHAAVAGPRRAARHGRVDGREAAFAEAPRAIAPRPSGAMVGHSSTACPARRTQRRRRRRTAPPRSAPRPPRRRSVPCSRSRPAGGAACAPAPGAPDFGGVQVADLHRPAPLSRRAAIPPPMLPTPTMPHRVCSRLGPAAWPWRSTSGCPAPRRVSPWRCRRS